MHSECQESEIIMRIGILTGGGDVPPLNSVLFSARKKSIENNIELIGFKSGWQGVLNNNTVLLNKFNDYSCIGGTFLKSSRVNLQSIRNGVEKANSVISRLGLDGLIIIGGDDTLSNACYISEISCILISKTIDNDIGIIPIEDTIIPENIINYFTLGFPTAIEKIISFAGYDTGIRTTAYSHERIMILESMGMHSGWLALASGMGNPDFIIIPEFPLDYHEFCGRIIDLYKTQRHAIVVIAEGATMKGSGYIKANYQESDDYDHPRFGGASYILRDMLKRDLTKHFNTRNINAVNPSYIYRSGAPNDLDLLVSHNIGETSVDMFINKQVHENILLAPKYNNETFEIKPIPLSYFTKSKEEHFPKRKVPSVFYDKKNYQISSIAKQYFSKIINEEKFNINEKLLKEYYGFH